MELRHLEQIVAICRSGSFSAAARQLQVSQPTLSKSIGRLERDLGVKLFDRSNTAVQPTALGGFVAGRAETLLHSATVLLREVQNHIRGASGRLTIGVGPATRVKPLPQVISLARQAFPELRIETRMVEGAAVARGVAEGLYDLAIGNRMTAAPYGELIRIPLFEDPIVSVVRAGHPLAACARVGPSEFLSWRTASFRIGPCLIEWLGPMDEAALERVHAFRTDDFLLLRDEVLGGDAIGWAPRFIFADDLAAARMVELTLGPTWMYGCWMLTTPGHWSSPVVQAIADFARAASPTAGGDGPPHDGTP